MKQGEPADVVPVKSPPSKKTSVVPKSWDLTFALVIAMLVVYLPAMNGGFIWDDDDYVTKNRALQSVEGLGEIWTKPAATVQYYPLTFTAFWIEYHLWGLNPLGFHLVNVLLQIANALLLWKLLSGLKVRGAWWAAAVFALHPVHVMSVAWITELKNVLSGLFFLSALLAYLQFCDSGGSQSVHSLSRRRSYVLALALYLCALFSKTSTSILPVAILLILWWKKGRVGRKDFVAVLPFFILGVLLGVFTLWLEKFEKGASGAQFTMSFIDRFLVSGRSFWFCLSKLLWPVRLTFIYPRWHVDATAVWQYLFPLSAVGLLAALWWARRWIGRAPFAAMAYFVVAFPALVMVQVLYMMRFSFVADHWQYLGSMSVIPLVVGGAAVATDRHEKLRRAGPMIGLIVLALLGFLTWRQGHIYRDIETLWRDTLAKNPNAYLAHNQLGNTLMASGRLDEAVDHFQRALRIKQDSDIYDNLGAALYLQRKPEEAIQQFEQALQLDPNDSIAEVNWGRALEVAGKRNEAISHYENALRISPDSPVLELNLGRALSSAGRFKEAIAHCERALQLSPNYTEARNVLTRLKAGQ